MAHSVKAVDRHEARQAAAHNPRRHEREAHDVLPHRGRRFTVLVRLVVRDEVERALEVVHLEFRHLLLGPYVGGMQKHIAHARQGPGEEKREALCAVAVCVDGRVCECRMSYVVCEVQVRIVEHYRTSSHAQRDQDEQSLSLPRLVL